MAGNPDACGMSTVSNSLVVFGCANMPVDPSKILFEKASGSKASVSLAVDALRTNDLPPPTSVSNFYANLLSTYQCADGVEFQLTKFPGILSSL